MIFIDTGYYRGLYDKKDQHHKDSMEIKDYIEDLNEKTVINTTVLVEILNRFNGSSSDVKEIYDVLFDENIVVQLSDKDYLKSLEINGWFDNSINYSDCTIIKTMMDLGINRIVTFDGAFEKVGKYHVISNM
jgi:predicted nucleic acid-binding protein